jgi:hypothetical protein
MHDIKLIKTEYRTRSDESESDTFYVFFIRTNIFTRGFVTVEGRGGHLLALLAAIPAIG